MPFRPPLTGLSLGRGVHSSVMELPAGREAFDNTPVRAVFADNHWEPSRPLRGHGVGRRQPLHVVDNGRNLPDDLRALTNHSGFRSYMDNLISLQGTLRGIH